jgi:hypothetical protein
VEEIAVENRRVDEVVPHEMVLRVYPNYHPVLRHSHALSVAHLPHGFHVSLRMYAFFSYKMRDKALTKVMTLFLTSYELIS